MANKILYDDKIIDLSNLKIDDECKEILQVKLSLGDYVEKELPRFKIFTDLLGFHYIDLKYFNDKFYYIQDDMKDLAKSLPINLRLLYICFLKEIEEHKSYRNKYIDKFLESNNIAYD